MRSVSSALLSHGAVSQDHSVSGVCTNAAINPRTVCRGLLYGVPWPAVITEGALGEMRYAMAWQAMSRPLGLCCLRDCALL